MDDLQLNISSSIKVIKKPGIPHKNASDYKFVSKPKVEGKIIARKRPQNDVQRNPSFKKPSEGPPAKVAKVTKAPVKERDLSSNLQDLSENKGKFQGKSYQDLSDDITIKQKPRSGGWISSLFKNNPTVPRIGQRLVKPLFEKVFAGKSFADLDIHPHSVANLQQKLGLKELMTVQQNSIPVILQGRDVLIRSQTGSGKTLAYALPIIEGLQAIRPKINRNDGIRVVVVVPTRELAVQTYELFLKLVKLKTGCYGARYGRPMSSCGLTLADDDFHFTFQPFLWLVPGLLSGGQKRKSEKAILRKGLNILVGTPGRINDHLRQTQSLNFAKTGCLVLDEADRLLDMGYEKDVAAIVKAIEDHKKAATYDPMAMVKQNIVKKINIDEEIQEPKINEETAVEPVKHHLTDVFLSKERQTILLSATLTKAVENLAGITMVDPVFVDTSEGKAIVADSLKPVVQDQPKTTDSKVESKKEPESKPVVIKEKSPVKEVKAPKETKVDNRRGLMAFNGSNHLDLFDKEDGEDTNDVENSSSAVNSSINDNSDSDSNSDYEYFKVQKEIETKKTKPDTTDTEDKSDVVIPTQAGNIFVEALKSAIIEDELILPASVAQTFLVVPMKLRLVTLCSMIVEHCVLNKKGGKMIVFMATLEMVDYHSELIETVLTKKDVKVKKKGGSMKSKKRKGGGEDESSSDSEFEIDYQDPTEGGLVPVDVEMFSLHGSMPHEQRIEVFKQFRAARNGVLICTDVAARGLDLPRVDLVLQYCVPASATDYVHRVGRTGRAAQVGAAVMFLLPSEAQYVRHLEQKRIRLRQADEGQALEALRTVAPAAATVQRAAIAVQAKLEHTAQSSKEWLARASRAYTSWVRFYAGYPRDVREWLDSRNIHLGHAAKAFALRDTPGALARRSKSDPNFKKERPVNRLTLKDEDEKKRPGFPKVKTGFNNRVVNKQSSMHTASEFDSGLPPVERYGKKKKKHA